MRAPSGEGPTLGTRLREARDHGFVGRAAERELFASMLAGTDSGALLWVHGPGGIGKSALLERLADDARAAGRAVVRVGGRTADGSVPEAFGAVPSEAGVVVVIDTFGRDAPTGGDVEEVLRRVFAPALPADALLVVASRRPPGPTWRTDPGWADLLRVIALGGLPPEDAAALLDTRGTPPELRERVLAFAGGHPLGLALAARSTGTATSAPGNWVPDHDIVAVLLTELVGTVPSASHRRVLEIAAHVQGTTEELLRSVLGGDDEAGALFDWLREQPYTGAGPAGLFPYDLVREVVDADFRWRDPEAYETVHRRIRGYLLERARTARGAQAQHVLEALIHLHRHGGVMPDYVTWRGRREVYEDVLRPEDHSAVVAMAKRAEGETSARIAAFWLDRQPAAFHVYRRVGTGEAVAFMAWLRLAAPAEEENDADPVVAAAWRHSRSAGPIREGEHLALARFVVYPDAYQRPSSVQDLVQITILSEWLRATRLAWSYLVVADWKFWQPQMDYLDQQPVDGEVAVGDRSFRLYGHDWRAVPAEPWLDRHLEEELFDVRGGPAAPANLLVLSRAEFDAAVRDALHSWRRPDRIAANPLTRGRLTAGLGADPADSLRQLLAEAVEALAQDPRTEHLYRAVTTTFFRGVPTQEAAAERLGLPLSTFRRHLARGLDEVGGVLWNKEVYGTIP
ncbi:ATP-binding protein [Streptomyces sp. SID1121]|uniref:ATP-binding protein n=1 Tax=Streptomyces sp. SID1121 TaxID=3425888 RepID=UPI0040562277